MVDTRLRIALISLIATLIALADVAARSVNVGFFEPGECPSHAALRARYVDQLRTLAGDSIDITTVPWGYRNAGWIRDSSRLMAREFAAMDSLDIIVTLGPWTVEDLLAAGWSKPIVAMNRVDPVLEGLLDSSGRPIAPNLTVRTRPGKIEMDLRAVKELLQVRRLGVLYFPTGDEAERVLAHVRELAAPLGIEVVSAEGYDIHGTFAFFKAYNQLVRKVDALYVFPTWGLTAIETREFFGAAQRDLVPTVTWEGFIPVTKGALLGLGEHSGLAAGRYHAFKTIQIITGAAPADLPTTFAGPSGLSVNLETAAACDLTLPDETLREARLVGAEPIPDDANRYSLRDVVKRALDMHPSVAARHQAAEAAARQVAEARSGYLPQVTAELTARHFGDSYYRNWHGWFEQDQVYGTATARQALFSLETIRSIQAARAGHDLSLAEAHISALDMELAVTAAYLECLLAEELLAAYRDNRIELEAFFDLTYARVAAEGMDTVDAIRWEQEQLDATAAIVEAQARLEAARVRLNALMNLPGRTPMVLAATEFNEEAVYPHYGACFPLLDNAGRRDEVEDAFVVAALDSNAEMLSRRQQVKVRKAEERATAASFFPEIGLEAGVEHGDRFADIPPLFYPDQTAWSVAIGVRLPLFLGGRRWHEYERRRASSLETEYRRDSLALAVMADVRTASAGLFAALSNVRRAVVAAQKAGQHFEFSAPGYGAGERNLVTVLDAQRNAFRARLHSIETRYEYFLFTARLAHVVSWSSEEANVNPQQRFLQEVRKHLQTAP